MHSHEYFEFWLSITLFSEIHVTEGRNRTNLIGPLFVLKKSVDYFFVFKFFWIWEKFCWQAALARFAWPCKPYYILLRTWCMILPYKLILYAYFVGVSFFFCAVATVFYFAIAKLVMCFFFIVSLLHFAQCFGFRCA